MGAHKCSVRARSPVAERVNHLFTGADNADADDADTDDAGIIIMNFISIAFSHASEQQQQHMLFRMRRQSGQLAGTKCDAAD